MSTYVYQRSVNYYETDQMGVVHHSNYVRFFEEARNAFWDTLGTDYVQMEKDGFFMPVLSVQVNYKKPLHYHDKFRIEVSLLAFTGVRIKVGYRVWNETQNTLACTGETSHCLTNQHMQPLRLPKYYPDLVANIQKELGDTIQNA